MYSLDVTAEAYCRTLEASKDTNQFSMSLRLPTTLERREVVLRIALRGSI